VKAGIPLTLACQIKRIKRVYIASLSDGANRILGVDPASSFALVGKTGKHYQTRD